LDVASRLLETETKDYGAFIKLTMLAWMDFLCGLISLAILYQNGLKRRKLGMLLLHILVLFSEENLVGACHRHHIFQCFLERGIQLCNR